MNTASSLALRILLEPRPSLFSVNGATADKVAFSTFAVVTTVVVVNANSVPRYVPETAKVVPEAILLTK